jgi:hypothetical protein
MPLKKLSDFALFNCVNFQVYDNHWAFHLLAILPTPEVFCEGARA